MAEAAKELKGKQVASGKKIYFEIQGPNGEEKTVTVSRGWYLCVVKFSCFCIRTSKS